MTRRPSLLRSSLCPSLGVLALACDAPDATPPEQEQPAAAEPEPATDEEPADAEPDIAPDDDDDCAAPAPRPRVMFVLDKSSSMTGDAVESGQAPAVGQPTRWAQLHALVGTLADVVDADAQLGAVLFPSTYAEASRAAVCDARAVPEAPVGPYTADTLLRRLPRADAAEFLGGSPVQAAYATAIEHLEGLGAAPTAIVLVTDGGINCVDEGAPLTTADPEFAGLVASARESLGIPTFVVGVGVGEDGVKIPEVSPHDALAAIARAGGVAHGERGYFTADDPAPLVQALAEFVAAAQTDTAVDCR